MEKNKILSFGKIYLKNMNKNAELVIQFWKKNTNYMRKWFFITRSPRRTKKWTGRRVVSACRGWTAGSSCPSTGCPPPNATGSPGIQTLQMTISSFWRRLALPQVVVLALLEEGLFLLFSYNNTWYIFCIWYIICLWIIFNFWYIFSNFYFLWICFLFPNCSVLCEIYFIFCLFIYWFFLVAFVNYFLLIVSNFYEIFRS